MKQMPILGIKALRLLEKAMRYGSIKIVTPEGQEISYTGPQKGPHGEIILHDWRTVTAILGEGDIGLGNAYMSKWWDSPALEPLLSVFMMNMEGLGRLAWGTPLHRIKSVLLEWIFRRNNLRGSQRNIMAHYDVGNDFYAQWLDPTMTYSSALFEKPETDLETGQKAKYARILERLGEKRRDILEIGCGWGGFLASAIEQGRKITALTISPRQHDYVRQRVGPMADVYLKDYRKSDGTYSAIVSIEMFEAVGERYWSTYFNTIRDRLTSTGIAMIQMISIDDKLFPSYRTSSDYIRHHIFPGGLLPSLSRFKAESQRAGLIVRDVFSFGQDYARTCREWLRRFDDAIPYLQTLGYEEGFMRGWRLYLAMCAGAFALGRTNVHQVELVPLQQKISSP